MVHLLLLAHSILCEFRFSIKMGMVYIRLSQNSQTFVNHILFALTYPTPLWIKKTASLSYVWLLVSAVTFPLLREVALPSPAPDQVCACPGSSFHTNGFQ